jgi:outer membrane protein assembly factor BamB
VNGEINAVNIDSASSVWTTRLDGRIFLDPYIVNDYLLVITDKGYIYSLSAESGEENWKYSLDQPILTRKIQDGIAFLGTFRGDMVAYDLTEQKVLWQVSTDHQVRNQPLVIDSTVFWANTGGDIYRINLKSGSHRQMQSLRIPLSGAPVQTNSGILLAGEDKLLYHLDQNTGEILSKTEFDGRLRSSPLYIQNSWFIAIEDRWLYEVQ